LKIDFTFKNQRQSAYDQMHAYKLYSIFIIHISIFKIDFIDIIILNDADVCHGEYILRINP